jgi:hypothetical protein
MQRALRIKTHRRPGLGVVAAARLSPSLALLIAAGCAEVLDIPDAPELVEQGAWSCLAEPMIRPAPLEPSALVRVQACDFVSPECATPVTGLSARVCEKFDTFCTNPIVTDLLDEVGLLEFEVPTPPGGFDGYLEVTSATELCTSAAFGSRGPELCELSPGCNPELPDDNCRMPLFARSMLFFNPPIHQDSPAPQRLPLIPAAAIPELVTAAGATLDPSTGNLFVTALDCDGRPATGVNYSIDVLQGVTQLYVHDGVVSDTNLENQSGVGGFLGVPIGFAEVSGFIGMSQVVGSVGVQTAPFTMTYTVLVPAPF